MKNFLDKLVEFEEKLKPQNIAFYIPLLALTERNHEISDLIQMFVQATEEERELIVSTFTDKYSFVFIGFSEAMASLAVREKSEEYLFEGLIAHAIEGGKFDWRENILVLSLIYHSAVKIGVDPVSLFKRAAEFARGEIKEIIEGFPQRKPEHRSIQAMGYEESKDQDGFRYKRTW